MQVAAKVKRLHKLQVVHIKAYHSSTKLLSNPKKNHRTKEWNGKTERERDEMVHKHSKQPTSHGEGRGRCSCCPPWPKHPLLSHKHSKVIKMKGMEKKGKEEAPLPLFLKSSSYDHKQTTPPLSRPLPPNNFKPTHATTGNR